MAKKDGVEVEALGIERVRELLATPDEATLLALVERDLEIKPQADAIDEVDRAVRYYRDVYTLLENFVTFRDFYHPERLATFQSGVLYLDGRSCTLCVDVKSPDEHMKMAQRSYAFLAYCVCTRAGVDAPRHIVAAFTGGDNDVLIVGRNGIFYDRQGLDWDARITHIVENPISIRQAFWSPYKRLFRFVSNQIESFAAAKDKGAEEKLNAGVTQGVDQSTKVPEVAAPPTGAVPATPAGGAAPAPSPVAAQAFDIAKFAGIFAAVGLALGFIVSAVTMLVTSFVELKAWQMPLVILGVMLLISGPSMLLAAFKLHQRHLAPLLDANGWAVNTRARLNIPFGASLTDVAKLPKGSEHRRTDPYQEKKRWPAILLLLLVIAAGILWWLWFTKSITFG